MATINPNSLAAQIAAKNAKLKTDAAMQSAAPMQGTPSQLGAQVSTKSGTVLSGGYNPASNPTGGISHGIEHSAYNADMYGNTPGQSNYNAGLVDGGLPEPTVATKSNPLVVRSTNNTNTTYTPPEYPDISGLNQDQLQHYIDQQNNAVATGKTLSLDELNRLSFAGRQMQKLANQPQDSNKVYTDQIATQQAAEDARKAQLQANDATAYDQYKSGLDTSYAQRIQSAQDAGRKEREAAQSVLSFSGFGRSTLAATQQAEIQTRTDQNIGLLEAAKAAELEAYKMKQMGATAEQLKPYEEHIAELNKLSAQNTADQITKMNEYNHANAASYQEKINNIMKLAQANGGTPYDKLSPVDKLKVDSFAKLAIGKDGAIDDKIMASVPSNLKFAVLSKSAQVKGALPGEAAKTISIGSGGKERVFQWNPETNTYDIPVGANGQGGSGIGGGSSIALTQLDQQVASAASRIKQAIKDNPNLPLSTILLSPDVATDMNFLKSNLTLDKFKDVKKGGGSLGAMSDSEWAMLANSVGSVGALNSKQKSIDFVDNIISHAAGISNSATVPSGATTTPKLPPANPKQPDTYNDKWNYKPKDKFWRGGVEWIVNDQGNAQPVNK